MESQKSQCSDPDRSNNSPYGGIFFVLALASPFFLYIRPMSADSVFRTIHFLGLILLAIYILHFIDEWRTRARINAKAKQCGEPLDPQSTVSFLSLWWQSRCRVAKIFFAAYAVVIALIVLFRFEGHTVCITDDNDNVYIVRWTYWGLHEEWDRLSYIPSEGWKHKSGWPVFDDD
jgi:hypothetical protein